MEPSPNSNEQSTQPTDACDLNTIMKQYDREKVLKDIQDAIKYGLNTLDDDPYRLIKSETELKKTNAGSQSTFLVLKTKIPEYLFQLMNEYDKESVTTEVIETESPKPASEPIEKDLSLYNDLYTTFLKQLESEKGLPGNEKITIKWIRDLQNKTKKNYASIPLSKDPSVAVTSVTTKPAKFNHSLAFTDLQIDVPQSQTTASFMMDYNTPPGVYSITREAIPEKEIEKNEESPITDSIVESPVPTPEETEEVQSEMVVSKPSESSQKKHKTYKESDDELILDNEEEEEEEEEEYIKKQTKAHKQSTQKKKKAPKEATVIEIGDTQGIEFIDGLEYITNIINDMVIPTSLFDDQHSLIQIFDDIKNRTISNWAELSERLNIVIDYIENELTRTTSLSEEEIATTQNYVKEIKDYITREALSDEVQNMSEDSFSNSDSVRYEGSKSHRKTADSHATGTSTDSTEQKESKMDPSTLRRSNRKRKSSQRVPVSYTETSDEEKQSHKRKKYSCLFHFRGLK